MGILWSRNQLNGYEAVLEMHSKQITSLSSYKLCIDHLFSDQIYNIGRIRVCFLSANKSTTDCPSMSNSNVMKQFAYGLLNLNNNVQIMQKN